VDLQASRRLNECHYNAQERHGRRWRRRLFWREDQPESCNEANDEELALKGDAVVIGPKEIVHISAKGNMQQSTKETGGGTPQPIPRANGSDRTERHRSLTAGLRSEHSGWTFQEEEECRQRIVRGSDGDTSVGRGEVGFAQEHPAVLQGPDDSDEVCHPVHADSPEHWGRGIDLALSKVVNAADLDNTCAGGLPDREPAREEVQTGGIGRLR
jgi:hypothetical protein